MRYTIISFHVFVEGLIKWHLKSNVLRKFNSYFEYEKIGNLNLLLSLVMPLSRLFPGGCMGKIY